MQAVGGLLGLNGGTNGTGITATAGAPITPGTNAGQLSTAYGGAQNSLQSQQALLQALQQQNGIGNQSQVYNQLQGVANGTGPNPAQAQLNQATGQNVANQAALMAGQRGAGANVGLIARQAAMQGANTQQNAIGQAATLQANQSLNAINSAGSLANTQAANQIGATTANTQANQSEQQILQNANAQQNNANVSNQASINAGNTTLANTTMQGQQGVFGGALQGAGAAMMAQGGTVNGFADGGQAPQPQSSLGQFLQGWAGNSSDLNPAPQMAMANQNNSGSQSLQNGMSDLVSNALTPGAPSLPADEGGAMAGGGADAGGLSSLGGAEMLAAQGGNIGSKLKAGGGVPGKAPVPGNSYANDKVKALLSPGEGVIDRETMQDAGPTGQMARLLMTIVESKKKAKK